MFAARVPLTNALQVFAPAPPPNTGFRVWEFVADPPILDISRVAPQTAQFVFYGATNRSFSLETTSVLEVTPEPWSPSGLSTGPMTNTFRIFPSFPTMDEKRFYRAKQE